MRILTLLLVLIAAAPSSAQQAPECAAASGDSVPTYELSDVEVTPRPRNYEAFTRILRREYPPPMREAGHEGIVQVRFIVEADGTTNCASATHATDPAFIEPTLRAVAMLRYTPARLGRRRVRVWVELPIRWSTPGRS